MPLNEENQLAPLPTLESLDPESEEYKNAVKLFETEPPKTPRPPDLMPEGMATDTAPIYTQPDKTTGFLERIRLESEKRTGVETTIPRAFGRLVGSILFGGDERKVEQKNALTDLAKGEWQASAAKTAFEESAAAAPVAGMNVIPAARRTKLDYRSATPYQIQRQIQAAGLDPDQIGRFFDERLAWEKANGETRDPRDVLADVVSAEAENTLRRRVHVSSRAAAALPEGGKNEKGFGYSFLGGGLMNLPYMGTYALSFATGMGPTLPLLASYDRRLQANREDQLGFTEEGDLGVVKPGMAPEEAERKAMTGAAAETAIEIAGGKVVSFGGKWLGKLGNWIAKETFPTAAAAVSKAGQDVLRNSPTLRKFAESWKAASEITQVQNYPGEIAEEWSQNMVDAIFQLDPKAPEGDTKWNRFVAANKEFKGQLGDILLTLAFIQGPQAITAGAKTVGYAQKEKAAERGAAEWLKVAGVSDEQAKEILANGDARAAVEYVTSDETRRQEIAKRVSDRSARIADDLLKTNEWMEDGGGKNAVSRFVPPTPADLKPGEDGVARYENSGVGIEYDAPNSRIAITDTRTGRQAFVFGGQTPAEGMEQAFAIADSFDREAQGRDAVNAKKRELLAKALEARGVDGTYVFVEKPEQLIGKASKEALDAMFQKIDMGDLPPQAFVDTNAPDGVDAEGKPKKTTKTFFILDNIRMGKGKDALGQSVNNIVEVATHEPVHVGQFSPKAAKTFNAIFDQADDDLKMDVIRYGISKELGAGAVDGEVKRLSSSTKDDVYAADSKLNALRRWFAEGTAYLTEGNLTDTTTGAQKLARRVRDFFKAGVAGVSDIRVLAERGLQQARGPVRIIDTRMQEAEQISTAAKPAGAVSGAASEQTGALPIAPGADGAGQAQEMNRPTGATQPETLIPSEEEATKKQKELPIDTKTGEAVGEVGDEIELENGTLGVVEEANGRKRWKITRGKRWTTDYGKTSNQGWKVGDTVTPDELADAGVTFEQAGTEPLLSGQPVKIVGITRGGVYSVLPVSSVEEEAMPEPPEGAEPPPVEEEIPTVKAFGIGPSDRADTPVRPMVIVDVGGKPVVFYRSSRGTSGKTEGSWYPMMGVGVNDWFVKGKREDMETGYGRPAVKRIMDFLNNEYSGTAEDVVAKLENNFGKSSGGARQLASLAYGKRGRSSILSPYAPIEAIKGQIEALLPPIEEEETTAPEVQPSAEVVQPEAPSNVVGQPETVPPAIAPKEAVEPVSTPQEPRKGTEAATGKEVKFSTKPPKKETRPQAVARVKKALAAGEAVPAADIDRLGLKVPDTYGREGDSYVKLAGVPAQEQKPVETPAKAEKAPEREQKKPTTQKEAPDAEAVRGDEGQVREGKPRQGDAAEAGVRQGAVEGGGDLQHQEPEAPRGKQEQVEPPTPPDDGGKKPVPPAREPEAQTKQSPLQREYSKLKSSHPTGVLAVRLGDFVEFFEDDAPIASEILGVRMDTRNGVRMTGVPYHAIDSSIGKLTAAGQDVHMVDYDERAKQRYVAKTIPANIKPTPPDGGGKKPAPKSSQAPAIPKGARVATTKLDSGVSYRGEFVKDNGDGTATLRAFGEKPATGVFRRYGTDAKGVQIVKDVTVPLASVKSVEPPADLGKLTPAQRSAVRRAAKAQEAAMEAEIAAGESAGADVAGRMASAEERRERARTDNETMFRVTPAEDAEYMAAVEAGDMEKAQSMVDEAAKRAGYNVGPVWHGSPSERGAFNVFSIGGHGFYFSPSKDIAARYAGKTSEPRRFFLRLSNPEKIPTQKESVAGFLGSAARLRSRILAAKEPGELWVSNAEWRVKNEAMRKGYDGFLLEDYFDYGKIVESPQYIVFDPSHIKSADPITRDDQGNVIPLSQRFNEATPDIRFRVDRSQTETPEFKRWFGDSKVVDADGKPLVVYHGTDADFTEFQNMGGKQVNVFGSTPVQRQGFFFGSSEEQARGFGKNVMPVFLSIKRPFDMTSEKDFQRQLDELESKGINPRWVMKSESWELFDEEDGKAVVSALQELGYDGAIFNEPDAGVGRGGKAYVAFFPEQIKSAIGNVGTFDPTNPDIRFRVSQPQDAEDLARAQAQFAALRALMDKPPEDFYKAKGEPDTPIVAPVVLDRKGLDEIAKATGAPFYTPAKVSQASEVRDALADYSEDFVRSAMDRINREGRPIETNDTVAKIREFERRRLQDAEVAAIEMDTAIRNGNVGRQLAILDEKEALVRDLDQAAQALSLVGSERGRQLAFLKYGLDRNLSIIYRLQRLRKATGAPVTLEQYEKMVAEIARDKAEMKKLAEEHERVVAEVEKETRAKSIKEVEERMNKEVLTAYRKGAEAERSAFETILAMNDNPLGRMLDYAVARPDTADVPFRTAGERKENEFPQRLREIARAAWNATNGLGWAPFGVEFMKNAKAAGFDASVADAYLYDFARRMGVPVLAKPAEKWKPAAPKMEAGDPKKEASAAKRRAKAVKEAVRLAVAENMLADGGKIAEIAAKNLEGTEWEGVSPIEVMEIVTGYPVQPEIDTRDELDRRVAMVRKHMLALQRLQELEQNKYPTKMTLPADKPDVTLRQLARELRDRMNDFQFPAGQEDERLLNAERALASRLRYAVEELQKAVDAGTPINEKAPRAVAETPEIADLRRTLKELRAAYEALPAVEAIKEARDAERARRAANKRYHFWQKRAEDAKNGVFPETSKANTAAERDAEAADYAKKAEAARREYWAIKKASPQERVRVMSEKVAKAEERLADLEAKLALPVASDLRAPKKPETAPASPEEAALAQTLAERRTAIERVKKAISARWREENADAIAAVKEAERYQFLVAKAEMLEDRIRRGDFSKAPVRPRVWSARIAIEEAKVRAGLRAINERIEWEANAAAGIGGQIQNYRVKGREVYKFYKTMWDLSAVGVQSARLFGYDPIYGTKLIGQTAMNSMSDEDAARFQEAMHNDADYEKAFDAGLALDQNYEDIFGTGMGEGVMRNLERWGTGPDKGIGKRIVGGSARLGLASQRAFEMYSRMMRFHVFKSIINDPAHANLSKDELRTIANMVNIMGGVGNTKFYYRDIASVMSRLMWSSRLFTAQWQTLTGGGGLLWNAGMARETSRAKLGRKWYQTAAPGALKLYSRSLAGTVALSQLFGAIGMLLGDRQPWEDEETMFWKAFDFLFGRRVIGSKSIDTFGGLTSYTALVKRAFKGSHVTMSGKTQPDDDWKAWAQTFANFARGRLRPDISLALSAVFGEDVTGQPFGPRGGAKGMKNLAIEAAFPITPGDMQETVADMWDTHGVAGVTLGLVPALASDLFGFSKGSAPRDPRYEINRHKAHLGQVRKALKEYREAPDQKKLEAYQALAVKYSFDRGVEESISALDRAGNAADKIAKDSKRPEAQRTEAAKAAKLNWEKARDILRASR